MGKGDASIDLILRRDSAGLRTVLRIFAKWRINGERAARLLGMDERTMDELANEVANCGVLKKPLSQDVLHRVSYMLGIWQASMILFPDESRAISFVCSPNTATPFDGRSPMDRLLDGRLEDLAAVREQFDSWCDN